MYLNYFGLHEPPFSITPDPRFVYLSPRHEDALAHLQYGLGQGGSGGFVQLTGEVGTGKTTLCRTLLEQLPDDVRLALILNPSLPPLELLESICQEFGIRLNGAEGSLKQLVDRLNEFLLTTHADGQTAVLLIDEAQNLPIDSLEQVRMLTNLETATRKLLQIILLGQPELRDVLARPELRQLAQRITARFHLTPLSAPETAGYVDHRMTVAGCADSPFTAGAHKALHRHSDGIPRLINIVAERALLGAYASSQRQVSAKQVNAAAAEVRGTQPSPRRRVGLVAGIATAAALGAAGMALAGWWWQQNINAAEQATQPSSTAPAVVAPTRPSSTVGSGLTTDAVTPPTAADLATTANVAWQRLVAQRRLEAPALNSSWCPTRPAPGLYCLAPRGSLEELIRLNRPVMLELATDAPYKQYLVASFGRDGVIVWSPEPTPMQHDALARYWTGRYADVWSMPGYVPELNREGERGPGVLWIKQRASTLGYAGDLRDPYFGPALTSWARSFQQQVGVRADGLIGPQTLQYLSASIDHDSVSHAVSQEP